MKLLQIAWSDLRVQDQALLPRRSEMDGEKSWVDTRHGAMGHLDFVCLEPDGEHSLHRGIAHDGMS